MNRNMEAITWALHARGLSPTAFRLLIQLCSYVNSARDDFEVWPAHKTVAEAVEISPSGVKRHLKELVKKGFIEVRQRHREDGGTSANGYRIAVNSVHRLPDGAEVNVTSPAGHIDLPPQSRADLAPQFTVEPCKEPLKERTSEILKIETDARDDCALVVESWNAMAKASGLSTCAKLSAKRRTACMGRLREHGPEAIREAIAKIPGSAFLRGETGDWSGASIDFLLRPDSVTKILEGKYDDRAKLPSRSRDERLSVRKLGMEIALRKRANRLPATSVQQPQLLDGPADHSEVIEGLGALIGSARQ